MLVIDGVGDEHPAMYSLPLSNDCAARFFDSRTNDAPEKD
jgi:hypothetical protein